MAANPIATDVRHQPGFGTVAALCLLVLYLPILVLIGYGFNANSVVSVWTGFSTEWFVRAFMNAGFYEAAANTLTITISATILSTLLATAAALGTTRVKPWRGQTASYMAINLPLMVPEIVTAVATLSFFALVGGILHVNFGLAKLILAHTVFCIPFAYMPIRARLEGMDLTLENAAADLYATPWMTFRRVTLPLLMPGVLSGMALAFIISFDDFTITQLVAGPGEVTMPIYIWNQIRRPITPELNAMCAILLSVSVLFVSLSVLLGQKKR